MKKTFTVTLLCGEFPPRATPVAFNSPRFLFMAYAIFKSGGKQYRVQEGDTISVDKLPVAAGDEIKLSEVLLVNDGSSTKVGAPTVDGAGVTAQVVEQHRGKKGVAFKFKRRKGFHKTIGFRHHLTKLKITGIEG
ncbi:MAG: 50S ribosomal protein L21 [Akkermansiaceae bacterium]|nr:50S ribosomal protein L21 [Akkermansiaceae bacterium]